VILQIDVTVAGPDQVLTGSATVDVEVPSAGQAEHEAPDLATQRMIQRSQALRWSQR
jgi:hypothetical protein